MFGLKLFPSITGHVACATGERELFSLPCRFGGLGMGDPTAFCESQFDASLRITAPLKDLIISQVAHVHPQVPDPSRFKFTNTGLKLLRNGLSSQLQRAIDLNSEPGASSWLLALPLQDQGYHLTKQEF